MYAESLSATSTSRSRSPRSGFSFEIQCLLGNMGEPGQPTAAGRAGELAHPLGRPGRLRDLLRLRRRARVHGLPRDPARARRPVGAPPSTRRTACRRLRGVLRVDGASRRAAREVLHDWAATLALDSVVDHGWSSSGGPYGRYRASGIDAAINWDADDAYADAGRAAQRLRLRAPARRRRKLPAGEPDPLDRVRRGRDAPDAAGRVGGRPEPARARGRSGPVLGLGIELRPGDHLRGDGARGRSDAHVRDACTTPRFCGTSASCRSRPTAARRSEPRQRPDHRASTTRGHSYRGRQPPRAHRDLGRRRAGELGGQRVGPLLVQRRDDPLAFR